jgi:hypothetical protein
MSDDDPQPLRLGSTADLARRMDRIEARHETLEAEVRTLAATVARVEVNQINAAELNKLRFDALDTGLKSVGAQLGDFIRRIEGLITGEVQTAQTREAAQMVADYEKWRDGIDEFRTQVRTSTRIFLLAIGSSWIVTAIVVYGFLTNP